MKKIFYSLFIISALLVASFASANPPCPDNANSLEAFAYCTTPLPNKMGRVLGRTMYVREPYMDSHNRSLMNTMYGSASLPQVYPIVPATSFASNLTPSIYYSYPSLRYGVTIRIPILP